MTKRIDELLAELRAQPLEADLTRLESAVRSRIDGGHRADIFGGRAFAVQLAVTCGALILGVVIAELTGVSVMPMPPNSEIVVLSDDSAVAPSVLLEGGLLNPFWRNLAITIVVAVLAGAAGGWLGVRNALDSDPLPLRQTVSEIVRHDLQLTSDQNKEIQAIENKYFERRSSLRMQVAGANRELADALMADMAFGREAQTASNHVEQGLGELQRATILYVLEVRDVLSPEQQMVYDRKVREVLTATATARP